MGQAGLGQQICQGLRMCLAIDQTDAGLAGPQGRWGLLAGSVRGWGRRRPPTPVCSAQPALRAGVPDADLAVPAGGAEAWPQSELWSLLLQRASLSTLAWRGPQDARHTVLSGQGTLARVRWDGAAGRGTLLSYSEDVGKYRDGEGTGAPEETTVGGDRGRGCVHP